jgi:hypothetical protein
VGCDGERRDACQNDASACCTGKYKRDLPAHPVGPGEMLLHMPPKETIAAIYELLIPF